MRAKKNHRQRVRGPRVVFASKVISKYTEPRESQASPSPPDSILLGKAGGDGPLPPVRGVVDRPPLPSLYSNICTEQSEERTADAIAGLISLLSPYHKKAAETLHVNVERLIKEAESLAHVGFMTLTFKENITDNQEASRRFKSLNTHFLATDPRFGLKIVVKEPQKRGAWHFHLIIQLTCDIRTGVDFEALAAGDYRSAGPELRQLWRDLRDACERYGFGRSELLPVRSNAQAMAYYLGKYISKGIGQRSPEQKGVRLVNYSRGWLRSSPKFAWNTANSALWRKKLQAFATFTGCSCMSELADKLGPNWAYRYLDDIILIPERLCEDKLDYRYTENGSKIDRETGEEIRIAYQNRIFRKIEDNARAKKTLESAESFRQLNGKESHRQRIAKHREKEKAKIDLHNAKIRYADQLKAHLKNQPPPQEITDLEDRRRKALERGERRRKDQEAEKASISRMMDEYPAELVFPVDLSRLQEAPF